MQLAKLTQLTPWYSAHHKVNKVVSHHGSSPLPKQDLTLKIASMPVA